MKKQLFFAAIAAAVAMTSCSNDETLSVNTGEGITFRTPAVTRATEATTENLIEFNVTALNVSNQNYFTNVTFSKQLDSSYSSETNYFWPGNNSFLYFYAYAPTELSSYVTIDSSAKQIEFTPENEIGNQVDFIAATALGNKENNEGTGVALNFGHKLSQIVIKAKNNNTDAYTFKVRQVKIGSVAKSGSYNFDNDSWIFNIEKATYTASELASEVVLNGTAQNLTTDADGSFMLVPQQLTAWDPSEGADDSGSFISVLLNISTVDGAQIYPSKQDGYGWVAVPVSTKWEKGKKYVYTLQFGNGGGYVDPEDPDDGWNPGDQIFGEPIYFTVNEFSWGDPVDKTIEVD